MTDRLLVAEDNPTVAIPAGFNDKMRATAAIGELRDATHDTEKAERAGRGGD